MSLLAILLLGGVSAGLLSGMLGIGGGVLVVPLLIYLLPIMGLPADIVVPTAIGTSLATIAVTTFSSAYAHYRHGNIEWGWVRWLVPVIVLGAFLGSWLGVSLNPAILQRVFAVMLLLLALRMIWKRQPRNKDKAIKKWKIYSMGTGIGLIASLIGIGGGALVVPLLHYYQLRMASAVAVASVCSVTLASLSTLLYASLASHGVHEEVKGLIGFLYIPAWLGIAATSVLFAPVGAKLATKLPVRYLQRAFAGLLIVVSIHLLVSG
ncbi:sulfite exporter TauE/SafE family protein [Aliidiomarina taiwanensis]|uniref:Probable membrane transporter protein n=1 Tax=Aliidiomarina taiwanensis TaxID=946228 RepID=A0A432X7X5_9GAMM|nr:sulfite exporter TauE/SafE family protein [Aliidiomarina taiwanensis]RUO42958.1 sulfite exporter TauE/SafE family protein [Aliidiomarina taiwanensis]